MESIIEKPRTMSTRLRAMVEIFDGELKIYPIADTDQQAQEVIDSLLLWRRDG